MSLRTGYRTMILFTVISMLVSFAARTDADQALGLVLVGTNLKTQSQVLEITGSAFAFTPTTVRCPESTVGTCTIRVEVSSVFNRREGDPQNYVGMAALIDGLQASPGGPNVLSPTLVPAREAATFSWMQTGVAHGFHTVDIVFGTNASGVDAEQRTLTIEVYKFGERVR